jgi:hypothetical protein
VAEKARALSGTQQLMSQSVQLTAVHRRPHHHHHHMSASQPAPSSSSSPGTNTWAKHNDGVLPTSDDHIR